MTKIEKFIVAGCALAIIMFNQGCGMIQDLTDACGGSGDLVCDAILGPDSLDKEVARLEDEIEELAEGAVDMVVQMDELEESLIESQMRIAELETGSQITEVIDPCGDGPNFDEVLLRLSNGDIVAYFKESGSREFLTVLQDGNYRTTDMQRCRFEIVGGTYREL